MKLIRHTVTLSPGRRLLLLECHTFCTADCCQGNAFQLNPKLITCWFGGERIDRSIDLKEEINRIAVNLSQDTDQLILAARDMESRWQPAEFRMCWADFIAAYPTAIRTKKNAWRRLIKIRAWLR
jgi:hypothetical protein